jgi:hypothetical protein
MIAAAATPGEPTPPAPCHAEFRADVGATRDAVLVSDEQQPRYELARQVVVQFAAGLAAGYAGPMAGAIAAGAAPAVLAGMDYISATIGSRRTDHATETLMYAAEEFGAETDEEFIEFVKAAVSDEEHQELLTRALAVAQDTAMRDKRRALGRVVAAAASDTGTKVDTEMLFLRVLADLDEPHIRVLRLMAKPPQVWTATGIGEDDPGLKETAAIILQGLQRHELVKPGASVRTSRGWPEPQYTVTSHGIQVLVRLAEPG